MPNAYAAVTHGTTITCRPGPWVRIAKITVPTDVDHAARLLADAEHLARRGETWSIEGNSLIEVAEGLAGIDPGRAEAVARSCDGTADRAAALARVTRTVARTDPARAEQMPMAHSITNPKWLVPVVEAMAGSDPARAAMIARNIANDADRSEALARIARTVARTDPASSRLLLAEAEQIARNLPARDARQAAYLLASIAATWLKM
jgi:hypothetical protein